MCIVFVLDGIFRPESDYKTNILYLYLTEYSGRKVRVNNTYILYSYLTEFSGRKVDSTQTQQQWMCMYCICIGRNISVGKLIQHNNNEGVLYLYWTEYSGRESDYKTNILYLYLTEYSSREVDTAQTQQLLMCMYCISIGRNIPAGKLIQHNNNKCVLYLYWTEYSGRKVNTTHKKTITLYCICIWRNIPVRK